MMNWRPSLRRDGDAHGDPVACVLAVCASGATARILPDTPERGRIVVAGYADLDAALARHRPALVLARAVSRGFDAMELGLRLVECGYGGRLAVVASDLADPALVRDEIEDACPGIAVEVLDAAEEAPILHAVGRSARR